MHSYTLITIWLTSVSVLGQRVVLDIPELPPSGTHVLSGPFQGFSMEMASFADMAGDLE